MRFCLLFIFISTQAVGQYAYEADFSIPVQNREGETMLLPWVGGLNSVQVNTLDVDHDGTEDLVLFERSNNKVLVFLVKNKQYQYAPDFEAYFPVDINNFLILHDYDGDGLKDIFTGNPLGIKLYRNVSQGDFPNWQPVLFGNSSVILTTGFSGKVNIQLQADDVPAIADVDSDGDLDILCMNFSGNGKIEYHKNTGTASAPDYVRITQNWGGITECSCGVFAFNNNSCNSAGRGQHAGGKFLMLLDVNADQKKDLIFSESTCDKLYLFINEGNNENPIFSTASIFPQGLLGNGVYPVAFYEDLTFDGIKDLAISSGVFSRSDDTTDFSQSLRVFKNNGTTSLPTFTSAEMFLQNEMIDVGENAVPTFFDYDGDGDDDLFVGKLGSLQNGLFSAGITLYKNTGTNSNPAFEYVSDDFNNLSSYNLYNLKPQFIDVNTDGSVDLVFTATNQSGQTSLYYIANTNNRGLTLANQLSETNLSVFFNENVHLTHINTDGRPDLLIGKANGAVEYWRNTGNGQPAWQLESNAFLGLTQSFLRQNPSIFIGDLNQDNQSDLVLGLQDGSISILSNYKAYNNFDNAQQDIVRNTISRQFESRNFGGPLWLSQLRIGSKFSLLLGNSVGGLQLLSPIKEGTNFSIFPNPLEKAQVLKIESTTGGMASLINATGQTISTWLVLKGNSEYLLPNMQAGVYLLRFSGNGIIITRRLVVY